MAGNTPIELGSVDFNQFRFHEIMNDELFWPSAEKYNNTAFRKLSENTALDIAKQLVVNFDPMTHVYQKEY